MYWYPIFSICKGAVDMAHDDSTPPMLLHVSLDMLPRSHWPALSAGLCTGELVCKVKHWRILRDTSKVIHDIFS